MPKKKLLLTCILFILLCKAENVLCQDTTIVGKAGNALYGAVIVTQNDEVFYIDSYSSWDQAYLGKLVKVKGRIITKKIRNRRLFDSGITSPYIRIVKRPEIELLSDG